MKRCKGDCKKELPLDSFSKWRAICKVCYKKKNREAKKRKRDADKQDKDKVCTGTCGKLLPGIKFGKGKSWCKVCESEYKIQRREADKQDRPKVCKGKWSCGELLPGVKFNKTKNYCKECEKKRKRTPEARETRNAHKRKRYKEDPQYVMRCRLRNRINIWLKGRKSAPTTELVGCTEKECNEWLESQFLPGMTWENRDLWHIDHMKPLESFDALDSEEQHKACHYTNLQTLWGPENMRKSNKDIYDMEWKEDHWHIKLGDEYVSRKEQVKDKISTHDYYPISSFY
jgi:hypothetical protein